MSSTTDNYGAPPPYSEAPAGPPPSRSNHLEVPRPKARNGISPEERRSMEDEGREMPPGWLRTYDPETHHQFFVDTTAKPEPRSIWHHPYDDPQYMQSLPPAERTRIQGLHRAPSTEDIEAESSADDSHDPNQQRDASTEAAPTGVHKLGRKMKDKLTSSTHTEREQKRRHREEQERKIYEQHQVYRRAMSKAMQTGEPQLIGKDKAGKEVYIEPPQGMGGSSRNYGGNGYVISPYRQGGYAHPNARYIRPQAPYRRPYGGGYGGGYGMPLLMGGGLGLGGGLLAGEALYGGGMGGMGMGGMGMGMGGMGMGGGMGGGGGGGC